MSKKRLDILLVEKGMVVTISKAQGMILAGEIFVKGNRVDKAGQLIDEDAELEIRSKRPEFVSRGGVKLAHALDEFDVDVKDLICLDIGASTGGFTDCLLKNGAKKIYAVDVGYGQLDHKLRTDDRVVVLEKTNIRELDISVIAEPIDLVTIDVSFIGLEKVFPKVHEILSNTLRACREATTQSPTPQQIIALIKPQFQVAKGRVGKGGVVREESYRQDAIAFVKAAATDYGWICQGVIPSPIKGPKGNVEYLACFMV